MKFKKMLKARKLSPNIPRTRLCDTRKHPSEKSFPIPLTGTTKAYN